MYNNIFYYLKKVAEKRKKLQGLSKLNAKVICRHLALVKSPESPACKPLHFFPFSRKCLDAKVNKRIKETIGIKSCIDSLSFYFARTTYASTEHVG